MSALNLVAYSFAVRTGAHLAHLRAKTYASHIALEEFYEAILELTDQFAEVWMGLNGAKFGKVGDFEPPEGDAQEFLREYLDWLTDHCAECCDDDESLENIVAEMRAVTARALFKLKNLA